MENKFRFVRVSFLDHSGESKMEWVELSDSPSLAPKVVGIGGWLIYENEDYLTLAMAIDEDGMVLGRFTIIRANIIGDILYWNDNEDLG